MQGRSSTKKVRFDDNVEYILLRQAKLKKNVQFQDNIAVEASMQQFEKR